MILQEGGTAELETECEGTATIIKQISMNETEYM